MSKTTLRFMGEGESERFRCRIYGGAGEPRGDEAERLHFLRRLASDEGVLDAPAYDPWIAALQGRGWLAEPEMVPPGFKVWRLNEAGRAALAELEAS